VHKAEAGAVAPDLRSEAEVRDAYRRLVDRFGRRPREILVQPMMTGGTEMTVGVTDDHIFGPLVVLGLGGVTADAAGDRAARLTPLTDIDADRLVGSLRSAPVLRGLRDRPAADLAALRDLLVRVSQLSDDLPEVAELDLSPVIARPDGAFVVDAQLKVTLRPPQDPFLRRLR
jgi:acyl-CoA synthetase (NDP forming)